MASELFIGLMSGTSLDGVDAALVDFSAANSGAQSCKVLSTSFIPYEPSLRAKILELHTPSENELENTALMANRLAQLYADCVQQLLHSSQIDPADIAAIGCHGQTIRHRPEAQYTLQIGNGAMLSELTDIDVVADFRSRDVAAGGQGAPLVPAFHQAVFADIQHNRVILNIGGIANLTYLPIEGEASGFDTGPGNMLMDAWTERHLGMPYDESGQWAAKGEVISELLVPLLTHDFFELPPPKSTGRELFNLQWLEQYLHPAYNAADVQRTLLEFTAASAASAIKKHCNLADEIYICGGGAHNQLLLQRLQQLLQPAKIGLTNLLGVSADWVEAVAFAWLARQTLKRKPGNLPIVTGARGQRILGAIYPH